MTVKELKPQPGPQAQFLASSADIAIIGGGAFGGKTYALLLEPTYHLGKKGFGAVNFRRTMPQHTQEGGAWDTSYEVYPFVRGRPIEGKHQWRFDDSGTKITFAHLEREDTVYGYKSSQIPLLIFDQLEDFTEAQFFYMLSRNRSPTGIRSYCRGACNPDPDSFLRRLLEWWIGEDGYPVPERAGAVRWFIRGGNDEFVFAASREELAEKYPDDAAHAKSLTFIPALIDDNPVGNEKDPGYRSNLMMLDHVQRERMLKGNWNVRPSAGLYFRRSWFDQVPACPPAVARVRHWDLAATKPGEKKGNADPDWTVGVRMAKVMQAGAPAFYIEHVERFRASPGQVEQQMLNLAKTDGHEVAISIPQDPGQAGKAQVRRYVSLLSGYRVKAQPETGNKVTRAGPLSAQVEQGNVKLVKGQWNEVFLNELENFPDGAHDDQVDAAAGAFNYLTRTPTDDGLVGLGAPRVVEMDD